MKKDEFKYATDEMEKLNNLRSEDREVIETIEMLNEEYNTIKAITYENSGKTNSKESSVENFIIKKEDQLVKLHEKKFIIEKEIKRIERELKGLKDKYRIIIENRLGEKRKSWRQIAIELNYSESYCRNRLIYMALMELDKEVKKNKERANM
ncbi:MAG: hypothetical protein ACRDAU_02860 [Clostridium sp.]